MTFSNPMGRTSKARGSSVNLSGKQKAEISHEQEMGGNGTTSMARKSKAKVMMMPGIPPASAPGPAPMMSASGAVVGAKKGGVIPLKEKGTGAGPNSSGLFNGQRDFTSGSRVPTQNAMIRKARKPKDEEAGESKKTEAKEVAAGSEPKLKDGGNWIAGAIGKPGALHRDLGVPEGEKIPAGKLKAAASKKGTVGRRARLAETLKSFK